MVDESHVTIPQVRGMHRGDHSRKLNLIDYGFRLPTALDNRPLKFHEFYGRAKKIIYASATPADWEIKDSQNQIVQQIIRPTGLIDPAIQLHSSADQIPHLIKLIKKQIKAKTRTLLITLTKRMAEELASYLSDPAKTGTKFKVAYLHSDIDTLKRSEVLDDLRSGNYDVLVGINLLRDGLDLP